MNNVSNALLAVTWRYTVSTIARQVCAAMLKDEQVPASVHAFISAGSVEMYDYYFYARLDSVEPTGEPERTILKRLYVLKKEAFQPMRDEGVVSADLSYYEVLLFVSHKEFLTTTPVRSPAAEELIRFSHETGFITKLCEACERYVLAKEVYVLKEIEKMF